MASTLLTFTFLTSISLSHLLINPSLAKHHSDHDHDHDHHHHSDHGDAENHHQHHHSNHNDDANNHHHDHHHHSDHKDHHRHSDHKDTEDHHHHHRHSGHNSREQEKPRRVKWTTQVLNKVCQKTQDHSFCRTLLGSDQTKKAEYLDQVAKISIKSALGLAKETSKKIKSLVEGGGKKLGGYKSCSHRYDDVIRHLKEANKFLKSGDYRKVRDEARQAQEEVKGCKGSVEHNNLEKHCSIIVALANI